MMTPACLGAKGKLCYRLDYVVRKRYQCDTHDKIALYWLGVVTCLCIVLMVLCLPCRGTMNDCEDFDSISRCGSNIGVKRINLTQTRNCSPRNAVCGSGMDCVDETPMRLQKIFDIPQLRAQECERHQQKTQSQRSKYGSSEIRWSTGFCSRLGPRNSNEDRFVVLPDLLETVGCCKSMNEESISNPATNGHTDGKTGESTTSTVSEKSQDVCNMSIVENCDHIAEGAKERHGYFAVYDGHCGGQAATYLEETLHVSIFNHPLYHTDLQTAIIETCVCTDKTFLAESRKKQQYSGSTALGAFIRGRELVVFNLGDCHAVVSCSGVAVDMSEAHKPNRCARTFGIMYNTYAGEVSRLLRSYSYPSTPLS